MTVAFTMQMLGCSSTQPDPAMVAQTATPSESIAAYTESTATNKGDVNPTAEPTSRKFRFFYDVVIDGLQPGAKARVWLPKAKSSHDQTVREIKMHLPSKTRETTEAKYGNSLIYFDATADNKGQIPVLVEYLVERKESLAGHAEKASVDASRKFLTGSKLVPADGSILKQVFADQKPEDDDPLTLARALYEKVDERMTYGKPVDKEWGRGDAFFACREGVGNCTDFHSMFIALARDLEVPAKFEIGFPLPPRKDDATKGNIGGYHCWAKFAADGRWIGVDISEADKHPEMKNYYFGSLTPDRVTFTTGRDLILEPKNASGPVNFLVYPHVEVDGKQHTGLIKRFRFEDVQ
jgi:transglutaminase-like putative cysteine protease